MRNISLFLRSLLFMIIMIVATIVWACVCFFAAPLSYNKRYWVTSRWNVFILWCAKVICGIRYEVKGAENFPDAPAIDERAVRATEVDDSPLASNSFDRCVACRNRSIRQHDPGTTVPAQDHHPGEREAGATNEATVAGDEHDDSPRFLSRRTALRWLPHSQARTEAHGHR